MEEESLNNELNKQKKPTVPEDFFEVFQNKLADAIEGFSPEALMDESALDFLVKTKKPILPEGYFDKSKNQIIEAVENTKVIQLKPRRLLYVISAIAAILLIGLLVIPNINNGSTEETVLADTTIDQEVTSSEEEISLEEMDSYLAYIDESTLIDYYIETSAEEEKEDLSTEEEAANTEENDAILDYLGEDFEDIYFDL